MLLSVTQKHIDKATRGKCAQDPISWALRDAGEHPVIVAPTYVIYSGYDYNCDKDLQAWILRFDMGMKIDPVKIKFHRGKAMLQ